MKFLKSALLLASLVVALVVAVLGCGGGGGGGGGGPNPPLVLIRIELPGQDGINIQNGTNNTFVVAGYDANNVRYVLASANWSFAGNPAPTGDPGTLSASGTLTAGTGGTARVTATATEGAVTPLDIIVKGPGAKITGRVRQSGTTTGIGNVYVAFYDNANVEVGRAKTLAAGTFTAIVPTTATRVNLVNALVPVGWYKEWVYRSKRYSAVIANCHALMVLSQALSIGATSNMNDTIFLDSTINPPPPPPDGCT